MDANGKPTDSEPIDKQMTQPDMTTLDNGFRAMTTVAQ
jgi:hypothetical protein